jgi:hypothetical protein
VSRAKRTSFLRVRGLRVRGLRVRGFRVRGLRVRGSARAHDVDCIKPRDEELVAVAVGRGGELAREDGACACDERTPGLCLRVGGDRVGLGLGSG